MPSANPQYRFLYITGRRHDGSVFFFVDSEPPNSDDYSPPGQIYHEVPATYLQVFETGAPDVEGPIPDRWGTWVSGLGLTAEQMDGLFKPFSQADSSTTRKSGGTGLGLTISKRLAVMLGGDVAVCSEYGKGSTFSVTVEVGDSQGVPAWNPRRDPFAHAAPATPESKGVVRLNCRILLAEDGPDNQRLIRLVLTKAGADVMLAENGKVACQEALAAHARGEPFDVILMEAR